MTGFLTKIAMRMQRFMRGRYGVDLLNRHMFVLALALNLVNVFLRNAYISLVSLTLLVLLTARGLSRNIVKRSIENRTYTESTKGIRNQIKALSSSMKDRTNRYYVCPKCRQIVRVPKGHGKIIVTCPKCREEFTRRS